MGIEIIPLQPTIGAEIHNVDVSKPLDVDTRDAIYAALVKHKVVFFRDQKVSQEQHIALASSFGPLQIPIESIGEHPEIRPVHSSGRDNAAGTGGKGADVWHSDYSDRAEPPLGAILKAVQLPSLGGDTIFSDGVLAYKSLDQATKDRIETLRAVHDITNSKERYAFSKSEKALADVRSRWPATSQPIVSVHPDSGARVLFVNKTFTSHIEGLDPEESKALLEQLYATFHRPEHQVRFNWKPGSLAFWDNRSCQHYAVVNYAEPRSMERIDIGGERVYGVNDKTAPHPLPPLGSRRTMAA